MRNKEHFLKDVNAVTKEVLVADVNFVEDAAHTLNNDTDNHARVI